MATMITTVNQINSTYTSVLMFLGFLNTELAFYLQPRWPHPPPQQVRLRYVKTTLQLCGHHDHHDHYDHNS